VTQLPSSPSFAILNASCSKTKSSTERGMYAPLSNALNYGLEHLSKIDVDGLPKIEDHIVFVPSDKGVRSDRDLGGSSFKPDIVLMKLGNACDFCGIKLTRGLNVSQFINKIPMGTTSKTTPSVQVAKPGPSENNPPQISPIYQICWKDILSAVEVKRDSRRTWSTLETFTNEVTSITNKDADEESFTSRNQDRGTSPDIFGSQTRRISALVYEYTTEN